MDKYLIFKIPKWTRLRIPNLLSAAALALGLTALSAGASPASAGLCGTMVNTTWSAPTDTNTTTNQTSFEACTSVSTLAGDGRMTTDADPYVISVGAIDNDTFRLTGTIFDHDPTGVGDSPVISLVLSNISWLGMSGVISNVIFTPGDNPGGNTFGLDGFTDDSISISGRWYCVASNCPAMDLVLGTFDVAVADVVTAPLPAALPLFLSGLFAVGFLGQRRRPRPPGASA